MTVQSDLFSHLPEPETLISQDGSAQVYRQWLTPAEAGHCFTELLETLAWEQTMLPMYGRLLPIPRLNAWYGDEHAGYSYSGAHFQPRAWTPLLAHLRDRLSDFCEAGFNSVLANLYRDGNDSVAWHSDDEPELGPMPVIASLSLGDTRRFRLRHRRRETVAVDLAAGDLLVMSGVLQQHWQHELAKTRKISGSRINLTFRTILAAR